ncbi:hypothetical protein [Actinopolymorpha pittospori]|uniref:Uncharacterized protein n=1 Tax=Actinopolymorpha pittospori TaxID=648752 RepID=A0A927MND5_9ACTN|nr:hypothetical protein [Actinopolymorpha pittospori]MBE1603714.1 hypothetical protein [Actinopolymorpha pittospori]
MRYTAGWNARGLKPDTPPTSFDDIRDAIAHLVRTIERRWDDDYRTCETPDDRLDIDDKWLPVHTALHNAGDGSTFHGTTGDDSLNFWIRPAGTS